MSACVGDRHVLAAVWAGEALVVAEYVPDCDVVAAAQPPDELETGAHLGWVSMPIAVR